MLIVALKSAEIVARAGFVVGTTYSLELADAGRFGLFATLVSLAALVGNWERHIDIQRRFVRTSAEQFDGAIARAIPFWLFNQAVLLPIFVLVLHFWLGFGPLEIAWAILIIAGEQVSNQAYNLSLFQTRYLPALIMTVLRSAATLALTLPITLFTPGSLTLNWALEAWGLTSGAALVAIGLLWWFGRRGPLVARFPDGFFAQHRASLTHFLLGTFAVIAVQFDRLAVGALLPLDQSGIYFRHVLIISMLYQAFNIATFNRIAPTVFGQIRDGHGAAARRRLAIDYAILAVCAAVGFAAAWSMDNALGQMISGKYHISFLLSLILILGALLRAGADMCGLLFHANHQEQMILTRQLIAFAIAVAAMFLLVGRLGMFGIALASGLGSASYLVLLLTSLRLVPERRAA